MKKLTILITLLFTGVITFSQTKLISHRSHSGKNSTFSTDEPGNFGLPPKKDTTAKKEEVKTDSTQKQIAVVTNKKTRKKKQSPAVVKK